MDAGTLLDRLEGYAERWKSAGGFVRVGLLIGVAIATFVRWMGYSRTAALGAAGVGVAIWGVGWLLGSCRVVLPSSRRTVVVALDVDAEGQRQYNLILGNLRGELSDLRLKSPLRVLFGGPRLVSSVETAAGYLRRFGIDLLVWGKSQFGHETGKRLLKFVVKHTLIIGPTTGEVLEQLARDHSLLATGKRWRIEELNDLNDSEILAEDLLAITLAFIGYSLYLADQFEDGVTVFERVVSGLRQRKKDDTDPALHRFTELRDAGMARLAFEAHAAGQHEQAVALLERLVPAQPRNIDLRMTLARAAFYSGDMKKAVHHTMEIGRIDRNHPCVPANRAFFAIMKRDYREVRRWYDRLLSVKKWKSDILPSVTDFLEERYAEMPDEHAYLYGLAITGGYDDEVVMAQDLTEFLRRTEHRPEFDPLRERASELLRNRRQRSDEDGRQA